ncbi:diacylglycerol kinase family protein [Solibacillus sp. CAU 1738]|uniref:diacylglycerol/lipid kinase family protein n=1 Tax=Solibacillus sp. CAU 1738 TaxID=3140363 RepID=UPI003260A09A
MQLHIILNTRAGRGKSEELWQDWQQQLSVVHILHLTQYEGHAIEIAKKIAQDAQKQQQPTCIVAIGGDGTIHEVINGVIGFDFVTVGAIKAGSGNDFARAYRVFGSPGELELFLLNPGREPHDCGIVHLQQPRAFMNSCGIGFDAFVTVLTNGSKVKKRLNQMGLGKLSYLYYVVRGLITFKPFELVVIHNGEERIIKDVWFATICNQPYFGGGMKISPYSKTDDGELELTVVHKLSRIKLLFIFSTVYFGKHLLFKEVTQMSGEDFQLHYNAELFCHTDGEIVEVANHSLSFYVKKHSWYLTK